MSSTNSKFYPQQYEVVFEAVRNALMDTRAKLKSEDFNTGFIKASAKTDFRTMYGEKIEVNLQRVQGGTQVFAKAKAEGPVMTSWGKTERTLEKLFFALDSRLMSQQQYAGGQAADAGTQNCPTCGQPLTYVHQYQRWYCNYCQKYPW